MTRIPATSRQWLTVPLAELTAVPFADLAVIAILPDDGREPADGDWRSGTWLTQGGQLRGLGLLIGPGGPVPVPAGRYLVWVKEYLQDGAAPVHPWERLTIGMG